MTRGKKIEKSEGDCYRCGKKCKLVAMKNHILKSHSSDGDELCFMMLMESISPQHYYWLIADASKDKSLSTIDSFLRRIWMECCGHMSEFVDVHDSKIGKNRKVGDFPQGEKIYYVYDFGTSTGVRITFLAETSRPKQREAVRLLARDTPPVFECIGCGKTATMLCSECGGVYDGMFFCDDCFEKHRCKYKHGLPVVNSPRMGMCGYTGKQDVFGFRQV
jgi:hypothetical protein